MLCTPGEDAQSQSLSFEVAHSPLAVAAGCSRGSVPSQGSLQDPLWVMQGIVSVTRERLIVRIHLHEVLGCPRLLTWCFPLLQFLGLPVIDLWNDGDEPFMIRDSKDLLFCFQLSGVIPACSRAPESKSPL